MEESQTLGLQWPLQRLIDPDQLDVGVGSICPLSRRAGSKATVQSDITLWGSFSMDVNRAHSL